ncbi:hypothetical protein LSAT2_009395 [Lamellibrachia satsuma]|nr:hypothetical protein LSAT2_009395 [Lamellibrachia satsuma]
MDEEYKMGDAVLEVAKDVFARTCGGETSNKHVDKQTSRPISAFQGEQKADDPSNMKLNIIVVLLVTHLLVRSTSGVKNSVLHLYHLCTNVCRKHFAICVSACSFDDHEKRCRRKLKKCNDKCKKKFKIEE